MNALLIILGVCALSVGLVTLLPLLTLGVVLLFALAPFLSGSCRF